MSEECTHDCSSCSLNCGSREKKSFLEKPHELSSIHKVIGVVSGKGGVGKSLVSSLIACGLQKRGFHTGVLDADITGPSIPKLFGASERATATDQGILTVPTRSGVDIMSVNLLLENPSDPVIWRGPVIAGVVKQFWTDVIWQDIDFLVVDMPPGTGHVPLTVFQSIPLDGIIVVTTPQDLVAMIVEKAMKMAELMNIPVLGVVENMSYVECPECGNRISLFGESHLEEILEGTDIPVLGRLPIDPAITASCDSGLIQEVDTAELENAFRVIEAL